MNTSTKAILAFCLLQGLLIGLSTATCENGTDVGLFAFNETVVLALNDSSATELDADGLDDLLAHVHEAMGCHEADCRVSLM